MKKDQVWAVYNCDKNAVEKVFYKKHKAIDYAEAEEDKDKDYAVVSVNLSDDEDHEVPVDPFGLAITVREVLDAMKKEEHNEDIELDDGPTPDEEEDACKAYGLKKPE